MPPLPRRRRLNVRAAIILAVGFGIIAPGLYLLAMANSGGRRPALLQQAQAAADAKPPRHDLALVYIDEYLEGRPDDPEALDLKARMLAATARSAEHLDAAISLEERAVRLEPEGKASQERRRQLVQMYLDMERFLPVQKLRLTTAEATAREMIAGGADDPGTQRLLGRVLELRGQAGDEAAIARAIDAYETARAAEPGDIDGASRLAQVYQVSARPPQPDRARVVLDDLLAANPSVATRLVRHRYYARVAADAIDPPAKRAAIARAQAEIDAALQLDPADSSALLAASEFALQQGDAAEARRLFDRIPGKDRDTLAVRLVQGTLELSLNQPEAAIESWRQGLLLTGGTDAEMTWRLAFILLQQGRIDRAEPLIEQFRRLIGDDPTNGAAMFLEGSRLLRLNRPAEAINALSRARFHSETPLQAQIYMLTGQAYEATRNESAALEQYAKAIEANPRTAQPYLARHRLLMQRDPAAAALELERGLVALPDNPQLLLQKSRDSLREQMALPAELRNFAEARSLAEQIKQFDPGDPNLVLLQADLLNLDGKFDEVPPLLEAAVGRDPLKVDLWIALSAALNRQGKRDEALATIQRGLAPDAAGDDAMLRIALARQLAAMDRGQEGRAALVRNDDRLRPDQRPLVWAELGSMHQQRREFAEARQAFRTWAGLMPDDPQPRLALLDLALAQGDDAATAAAIDDLKGLAGGPGSIYYDIARAQDLLREPPGGRTGEAPEARARRLDEAEALIVRVEAETPYQRYAYLLRGMLNERRNDPDRAIAAYERSLEYNGGQSAVDRLAVLYAQRNRLADLERLRRRTGLQGTDIARRSLPELLRAGHREAAEELARQIVQGNPDSLDARVWQARVLNTLGQPEEAEKELKALIERHPEEPGPWMALVYFYAGQGNRAEAVKTVEQMKTRVTKVDRPEFLWAEAYRAAGALDQAAETFAAARSKWPDDLIIARSVLGFYEATGRQAQAVELAREVLKRDPSQHWAGRGLAILLSSQLGRSQAAWDEAWALVKDVPAEGDTAEDRLARGLVLTRCPDPARRGEGTKLLEQLVADLPADRPIAVSARKELIGIYNREGQKDRLQALIAGEAAGGTNPTALAMLTETLVRDGKVTEAASQLERLAILAPRALLTAKIRALVLKAQGHPDEAAASLEAYYEANKNDREAEVIGRDIVSMLGGTVGPTAILADQTEVADRVARRVADRWPATAWMLGRILARADKPLEAAEACRTAARAGSSRDAREAVGLAIGLAVTPGATEAVKAIADEIVSAALDGEPEAADLLLSCAFLRRAQGRHEDEAVLYRRVKDSGSATNPAYLNNLAWTLSEDLNKPEEALEVINDLLETTNDPQFLDTRAQILVRLGRYEDAVKDLEKVIEKVSNRPIYQYHLARAYYKAGNMEEFRKHRDLAKEGKLDPKTAEASEREEMQTLMAL